MAKRKYIDYKKAQSELFKRTEGYAANVGAVYRAALTDIINLVKGTELEPGKPFNFSDYGYSDEVTPILRSMYSRVYQIIRSGVEKEWLNANEHNDGLVKAIFGEHSIEDNHFARYFQRNMEAMNAFFARKTGTGGLNLSQKVWKYTGIYKDELEDALDLAIGEGTPANRLAKQIQQYLNEPDRFYRRFRVKIGENEDGTPKYGRIWKRRIYDKETDSYKWIDDDPRKYHPGRGVYRSSYRNAQRLARTETNIAYRTADYERWQQMDFVVGVEIKLSNNHPVTDICDDLKGQYPKDFKWTGWHPNCRCYMVPVLATPNEVDKMLDNILDGKAPSSGVDCSDEITDYPPTFKAWAKENEERIDKATAAGTLPYFVKDNQKAINKILHGLTPEQQAARAMGDLLDNPLELLEKHGMAELQALYNAVQTKLGDMLKGTLEQQLSTLDFEIDWVIQHKKYSTWEGAANAYKKAKANVELQLRKQRLSTDIQSVEAFTIANKVDSVSELYAKLKAAYDSGDIDSALRILGEAQKAIEEYKNELLSQGLKSTTDLEKYCDKHRTFKGKVTEKTFGKFQDRMIAESGPAWQAASEDARRVVQAYTNGTYDTINRSYWKHHTGCADGSLMDTILDGCTLKKDTVLRRGCNMDEMGSIFGEDFLRMVKAGDIDGLNAVAGCRGINEGFISTSFDMSGGFWKSVDLRIYAPKGTQALYAKPISGYGDRYGKDWDGLTANKVFDKGRENEVIVHRGYEYRFIKAEAGGKKSSSITIYVELLSRDKRLVR